MAEAIRRTSLGEPTNGDLPLLTHLQLADESGELNERGRTFDDAWWVYEDKRTCAGIFRQSLLAQPEVQALGQMLRGRGAVPVLGAVHYLARHGLADASEPKAVRRYLQMLNSARIVAYSKQSQTVRSLEPAPIPRRHRRRSE